MSAPSQTPITIFVDGASRGNPGKAGLGVYCYTNNPHVPVLELGCAFGKHTNNVAEYAALALALEQLIVREIKRPVRIFADSLLMVQQVTGVFRVRNKALIHWHALIMKLKKEIPFIIAHVRREKNTEADRLANQGIDTQTPVPASFDTLCKQHVPVESQ